jgi:hypothetical protein
MADATLTLGYDTDAVRRGAKQVEQSMKEQRKSVESAWAGVGKKIAGYFTIGAIKGQLDQLDRIGDLAQRFDTDAEAVQRFGNMLKISGTDIETGASALTKLQKNLAEADPAEGLTNALQRLGIDTKNFVTLDPDKALLVLADAFQRADAKGTGFADAFAVLGKQAGELFPALRSTRAELEELGKIPVVSNDDIGRIQHMEDLWDEAVARAKAGTVGITTGLAESVAIWREAISKALSKGDLFSAEKEADKIARDIAEQNRKERSEAAQDRAEKKKAQAEELAAIQRATQLKKQAAEMEKQQRAIAKRNDEIEVLSAKLHGSKSRIEKTERAAKIKSDTQAGIADGLNPIEARRLAEKKSKLQEDLDFADKHGGRHRIHSDTTAHHLQKLGDHEFKALDAFKKMQERDRRDDGNPHARKNNAFASDKGEPHWVRLLTDEQRARRGIAPRENTADKQLSVLEKAEKHLATLAAD